MNPILFGFLVLLTTSLMGSSFAIGKIGLDYLSPLLLVGIRFTFAGVLMALFVIKKPLPKEFSDWVRIFLLAFSRPPG